MDNKYNDIINKNPAESYLKSIKTKQAWTKYRNNFKQGMKRRKRIDYLTGNEEDKFDFKEKTKLDYSCSSIEENYEISIKDYNLMDDVILHVGTISDKNNKEIGSFEYYLDLREPDYIYIENMKKISDFSGNFSEIVFNYLKENYSKNFKGLWLLPISSKLVEHYKSLGFEKFFDDGIDHYYKLEW